MANIASFNFYRLGFFMNKVIYQTHIKKKKNRYSPKIAFIQHFDVPPFLPPKKPLSRVHFSSPFYKSRFSRSEALVNSSSSSSSRGRSREDAVVVVVGGGGGGGAGCSKVEEECREKKRICLFFDLL